MKRKGFLFVEMLVAITLLAAIILSLAILMGHVRQFGKYNLQRQKCIQAANAQLDSITATSKPLPENKVKSLWPGVKTQITVTQASGKWDGLELVLVTATGKANNKDITVEMGRYVNKSKIK